MTEAMPLLQKAISLSYAPGQLAGGNLRLYSLGTGFSVGLGLHQPGDDHKGQHTADEGSDALGPGEGGGHHCRLLFRHAAQCGYNRRHGDPQEAALYKGAADHGDAAVQLRPAAQAEEARQDGVAAGYHRHQLYKGRAHPQEEGQGRGKQADADAGEGPGTGGKDKEHAVDQAAGDELGHGQGPYHHRTGGKELPRQLGQDHQGDAYGGLRNKSDRLALSFHSVTSESRPL